MFNFSMNIEAIVSALRWARTKLRRCNCPGSYKGDHWDNRGAADHWDSCPLSNLTPPHQGQPGHGPTLKIVNLDAEGYQGEHTGRAKLWHCVLCEAATATLQDGRCSICRTEYIDGRPQVEYIETIEGLWGEPEIEPDALAQVVADMDEEIRQEELRGNAQRGQDRASGSDLCEYVVRWDSNDREPPTAVFCGSPIAEPGLCPAHDPRGASCPIAQSVRPPARRPPST